MVMLRRYLLLEVVFFALAFGLSQSIDAELAPVVPALGQGQSQQLSLDTRVAILENRMDVMQVSLNRLDTVPSQLARIEEKLNNLDAKSGDNAAVLQEAGVGLFLAIVTGILSFMAGRRQGKNESSD